VTQEQFITKDSGEREEFDSGMKRDTEAGKPRFDLMLPEGVPYDEQILTRFAMLLSRGAEKYDARNWEQGDSEDEIARAKSSAFRHFMQWICGERDEDHMAAVIFNLMVVETIERKIRLASEPDFNELARDILGLEESQAEKPDRETHIHINFEPMPVQHEHVADAVQASFERRRHVGGYIPPTLTM
jgi:hypothetical protein